MHNPGTPIDLNQPLPDLCREAAERINADLSIVRLDSRRGLLSDTTAFLVRAADRIAQLEAEMRDASEAAQLHEGVSLVSAINQLKAAHKEWDQRAREEMRALRARVIDEALRGLRPGQRLAVRDELVVGDGGSSVALYTLILDPGESPPLGYAWTVYGPRPSDDEVARLLAMADPVAGEG